VARRESVVRVGEGGEVWVAVGKTGRRGVLCVDV
jgi:hypothetical protein